MDQRSGPVNSIRTDILGVPVDAVNMRSALQIVRDMLASGKVNTIVAVNPEKVIAAQKNPELLRALQDASLLIPDGIGVVAAARLLHGARMERVAGSDLMPEICRLAATEGHSVFLYGAKPEIVSQAAKLLRKRYPGLEIAGTRHGYVADDDMDQLIETINRAEARVLFVGLGSPRQELWMSRNRDRLNVQICQGVGGSFDAICGNPRRAPKVMRKLNLEWLYRLVSQPKRAHRQLVLPKFAAQVFQRLIFRRQRF